MTVSAYARAEAPATPAMPMPASAHDVAAARRKPERGEFIAADGGSQFFEGSKNSTARDRYGRVVVGVGEAVGHCWPGAQDPNGPIIPGPIWPGYIMPGYLSSSRS